MYILNDYDKVQYLEAGLEDIEAFVGHIGLGWDSEKGVPTELLRHSPSVDDETVDQAPRRDEPLSMRSSKWLEQA